MNKKLADFSRQNDILRKFRLTENERTELLDTIESEYLVGYVSDIIRDTEAIIAIEPDLSQKKILEIAAKKIVKGLDADGATIRLFDPESLKMTSFGAYGVEDYKRQATVPVLDSISGRVVQERRSIVVPSISKDPLYKDKRIIKSKGFHSLLAVPLFAPTYLEADNDLLGSLQIYYREDDRCFNPLEIILAEMLARRVSYVLIKKKVLDLLELNNRKEKIVNKIFVKLSMREGIKLKDLFILLFPELEKFLELQSCSLFTVSDDQRFMHLEAAYPLEHTYHEIGHSFTISHHPYFETAVLGKGPYGDRSFERITPAYTLIKDPLRSELVSSGMQKFVQEHRIHSFLLVPLRVDDKVRHLLTFYATKKRHYFSDEEIELLIFFGKEIMKASKLEFFSDILHDFKNPAIAVAGFARRAKKLLEANEGESTRGKLLSYLDIIGREASRLQDLALTMSGEGREEVMDLGGIARQRFQLNEEVIHEKKRDKIIVVPPELEENLFIFCPRFALERVLDNLLSNAINAIPEEGGLLLMRAYRSGDMVCLEICNSGEIPAYRIEQLHKGEVKGRGLSIIHRFVTTNHGKIKISAEDGMTTFSIMLPLTDMQGSDR